MSFTNDLKIEFDEESRILSLSADEKMYLNDEEDLRGFCGILKDELTKHTEIDKCFLAVDISKVVVDPNISDIYMELAKELLENYLYPNGLARYGYEITRVTVIKSSVKSNTDANLFSNKAEAINYLKNQNKMPVEV